MKQARLKKTLPWENAVPRLEGTFSGFQLLSVSINKDAVTDTFIPSKTNFFKLLLSMVKMQQERNYGINHPAKTSIMKALACMFSNITETVRNN